MSTKETIQAKLVSLGFEQSYIQRAFKVSKKNWGHISNIEVITEIIVRLQNKDKATKQLPQQASFKSVDNKSIPFENNNNNTPFISHISMDDALKLKINDKIDHRDHIGRFIYSTVKEKQGTNLKIHYDTWSRKWDTWSDFSKELHRFAKAGSISQRLAHRFANIKPGSYIDVNPMIRHPEWKASQITRIDHKSGQIQVVYHIQSLNKNFLIWAHVDNTNEIAKFTSKSMILQVQNKRNENSNNSKKRKLSIVNDVEPPVKKRKLSHIGNYNRIIHENDNIYIYKQKITVLEQQIECLRKQNEELSVRNDSHNALEQRLALLECETGKINAMSLDELNELKIATQKRMKLIEDVERQLMENTFRCIACKDNLKNISFDACSHISLCDKCESELQNKLCPICQAPYTNAKKVNF